MPEQYHYNPPGSVFVFGSNLAGVHGAGAARTAAKEHGAIMGQGMGRQGSSYAIPTKDHNLRSLLLREVQKHIIDFLKYASEHKDEVFYVTKIGCGYAGFTEYEISPLFKNAPSNCLLPDGWR